jgi:hypothetical protein
MSPIPWIVGGAVLAAGVAVAVLLTGKRSAKTEISPVYGEAVREHAENADSFAGLYESMHIIKEGGVRNGGMVFGDWGARIRNMDDAPALNRYWNDSYAGFEGWDDGKMARKAGELLAFARDAGVVRSEETEVTVDRTIFRYYVSTDGSRIEPGTVAAVRVPYWAKGNSVLEKGQIYKKEESEG